MEITDTAHRSMLIDLVWKHPQLGWLPAPNFRLQGRGTVFASVPDGRFGIRICSLTGADVILFENGKELLTTSLAPNTQVIEIDALGQALLFSAADSAAQSNQQPMAGATGAGEEPAQPAAENDQPEVQPQQPKPLSGPGLVYLVVRFARENTPYAQPPQEECEIAFQMMAPNEYDNHYAKNLRLVELPPEPANKQDPLSRTPPASDAQRPSIQCNFTGHHKH